MLNSLKTLIGDGNLTPHGFCLLWRPGLLWLHAISDSVIGLSYYSIPVALFYFERRLRDLEFGWMFWLFAVFIMACGTTHWLSVLTLWVPAYRLAGIVKAFTAAASSGTAITLWLILPKALSIASPSQVRTMNLELHARMEDAECATIQLRESEARYRALYDSTPCPMHTLDLQYRLTGVSDYWCELLGYRRDDVLGLPLEDFLINDPENTPQMDLRTLVEQGEVRNLECRFRTRSGETLDMLISITLERDASGAPIQLLGVMFDITQRKSEEIARQARDQHFRQAQKMDAISTLTGGVAHGVNNMLTVVDNSLERLQRRHRDDKRDLATIDTALQASQRTGRLIQQLMAFARQQTLSPHPISIAEAVAAMLPLIERGCGHAISLQIWESSDTPWQAMIDRSQFEVAMLNLAMNAATAIQDTSGQIAIEISHERVTSETSTENIDGIILPDDDYIRIVVADTGIGMSDEMTRRAVEPFFTTKPMGKSGSLGLGLPQAYGFASQSGGSLQIESVSGHGTRVSLLLPRCKDPSEKPDPTLQTTRSAPDAQATLLVIDDETELCDLTAEALSEYGYQVMTANSGAEGLQLVKAHPEISLIFTDIVMPGEYNGVTMAREALKIRPNLPVIFVSGFSADALRRQNLPDGTDLIQKPYRISVMADMIQSKLVAASL